MKIFSYLNKVGLEQVTGAVSSLFKGRIFFRTDDNVAYLDNGTSVEQMLTDGNFTNYTAAHPIALDTDVSGVLPYLNGGTGISGLTGYENKALIVNGSGDGFDFSLEDLDGQLASNGTLDIFYTENFLDTRASDFTVSGSTTIGDEISSPISGDNSISYTLQAGSAIDDYIRSPSAPLDKKQRGQPVGISFYYTSVSDEDITFILEDNFSNALVEYALPSTTTTPVRFSAGVETSVSATSLRWKLKVTGSSLTTGDKTVIDDIQLTTDPTMYKRIADKQETITYTGFTGRVSSVLQLATVLTNTGNKYISVSSTSAGTLYTFLDKCSFVAHYNHYGSAGSTGIRFYNNSTSQIIRSDEPDTGGVGSNSLSGEANVGDYLWVYAGADPQNNNNTSFSVTAYPFPVNNIVTPVSGQKQYSVADSDFTVTGTNWTTDHAVAVPYRTAEGVWRLKFNISGSLSSGQQAVVAMSGITHVTMRQTFSTSMYEDAASSGFAVTWGTNSFGARFSMASTEPILLAGDIEISGRPTWADDTTNHYMAAMPAEKNEAGLILPFGGGTAQIPDGYLLCDGSEVSKISYSHLYGAVGNNWTAVPKTTTFNLPDLRGAFLRGSGTHSTNKRRNGTYYSGPNIGDYNNDTFLAHQHYGYLYADNWMQNGGSSEAMDNDSTGASSTYTFWTTGNSNPIGSTETKPFNAGINYIIKY